jgi:hypothetical protein
MEVAAIHFTPSPGSQIEQHKLHRIVGISVDEASIG